MIRYSLICSAEHAFDGWFRSSADYEAQADHGLLSCPVCGSPEVDKALMAPAVPSREKDAPSEQMMLIGDRETEIRGMIKKLREEVTRNAENVGPRFAEVARQMHEGEVEKNSVYGVATPDEVRSLRDDGIEFHPLPRLPDDGN